MQQKDRLQRLLDPSNTTLNGIDFVEIASATQTALRVHFLNTVPLKGTVVAGPGLDGRTVPAVQITGGETIPTVAAAPIHDATDWSTDAEGRPTLMLSVPAPGDFSIYTLTLNSVALDGFFNHVNFSFKALCPSDFDCEAPPKPCPPLTGDIPPIDYLAKDFLSFRKALTDFSGLRYPEWQERSEADFGMMFLEALSSLGDDLSYTQDRVAAEATLETATQRRSIVRHARLVDYEPRPVTSSSALVQLDVTGGPIPTGLVVSAAAPDGSAIDFETGTGLIDPNTGSLNVTKYAVSPTWNRFLADGVTPNIVPYYWDDSQRCLLAGSTEMWVLGHGFNFQPGQNLLIDTAAATTADPHVREVVQLTSVDEQFDPLFLTPPPSPAPTPVTHLVWGQDSALASNHDLTRTILAGNLIPATQGRRYTESFAIDQSPAGSQTPVAIQRTGPNSTPTSTSPQYLYTLANAPLAWLPQIDPTLPPLPEILVVEQPQQQALPPVDWTWLRSLLNAEEFENAFTIDPARYRRIARNSDSSVSYDYDGDAGDTIRFGDDVFGEIPESGSVFQVAYRVGGGEIGNVAADSITKVDPSSAALISAVTNPFPASGGADAETDEQVRRRAPQAFRAIQYRAVRPEDYEAAAQTLPWVLRAGTEFRWTGSWLTVFTTADAEGTEQITVNEHTQLIDLLNRYRLAGYESYVPAPHFVSIDLIVAVCACPSAFRGDVEAAVVSALSTTKFADGSTGFFYFDNFTFGTPLERSALEAAIQATYGVAGVVSVQFRRRGVSSLFVDLPETLQMGPDEILRMDNDPSRPESGSLQVTVGGGK
ncbi:MAG TPA: baseplate J/gp47 family protein [Terriglobia bacterium]|nr:baseplate J/gp47 family protein [Terriglobia bacterium]